VGDFFRIYISTNILKKIKNSNMEENSKEKSGLDFKDWSLIVCVGLLLILCVYFFVQSSGYKKDLKKLHKENDSLEVSQRLLESNISKLKNEAKVYEANIKNYEAKIQKAEKQLKQKDIEISNKKKDLDKSKKEYEKTKKEIEKLEDTPIKRTGSELLNSIKEKTK
jgi:cell division protein FtsB